MTREEFTELMEQQQKPLRRFLCALCKGDSFRADDLAQETLLKAYLSFSKFEGRSKFSTWLFRIACNCFYDSLSMSKRESVEPVEQAGTEAEEETLEKRFDNQRLYLAIDKLSEKERLVVLLFYMEEKSLKEITRITGLLPATVRSHLHRARRHLREYIDNL